MSLKTAFVLLVTFVLVVVAVILLHYLLFVPKVTAIPTAHSPSFQGEQMRALLQDDDGEEIPR